MNKLDENLIHLGSWVTPEKAPRIHVSNAHDFVALIHKLQKDIVFVSGGLKPGNDGSFFIAEDGFLYTLPRNTYVRINDLVEGEAQGFHSAKEYYAAKKAGFVNPTDYKVSTDLGYASKEDFERSSPLGFRDCLKPFLDACTEGCVELDSKGFRREAQVFDYGIKKGFSDFRELLEAVKLGFSNAKSFQAARTAGFDNFEEYSEAESTGCATKDEYTTYTALKQIQQINGLETTQEALLLQLLEQLGDGTELTLGDLWNRLCHPGIQR